jgi:hypothetical protein
VVTKKCGKQIQMMVLDVQMFHHSQVIGPDTTEIRRGDYDYCGIQQLLKVEYQTVEEIYQQTWQLKHFC